MRTRDVGLVAVFVLAGRQWEHVYAVAPHKVEFMFQDDPALFALQREYQAGQTRVDARAFLRTYKTIMGTVRQLNGSSPSPPGSRQEAPPDALARRD